MRTSVTQVEKKTFRQQRKAVHHNAQGCLVLGYYITNFNSVGKMSQFLMQNYHVGPGDWCWAEHP